MDEPPQRTPAQRRGRLIRQLGRTSTKLRISWDAVHIGRGVRAKVIDLARYRRKRRR